MGEAGSQGQTEQEKRPSKSWLLFQLSPKLKVVLLESKRLYSKTQPTQKLTADPSSQLQT